LNMSGSEGSKQHDGQQRTKETKKKLTDGRGCIFRKEVVPEHPPQKGVFKLIGVSTKSGLCRDRDYAEFRGRGADKMYHGRELDRSTSSRNST
jgi:hypothetical protein